MQSMWNQWQANCHLEAFQQRQPLQENYLKTSSSCTTYIQAHMKTYVKKNVEKCKFSLQEIILSFDHILSVNLIYEDCCYKQYLSIGYNRSPHKMSFSFLFQPVTIEWSNVFTQPGMMQIQIFLEHLNPVLKTFMQLHFVTQFSMLFWSW